MAESLYLFNVSDGHNAGDDRGVNPNPPRPLHELIEEAVLEEHLGDGKISSSVNLLFGIDHIHFKARGFDVTFWIYRYPYGKGIEGSGQTHQVFGVSEVILESNHRCPSGWVSPESQDVFNPQAHIITKYCLEFLLTLADASKVWHRD